ncbi:ABC transporter permease [Bradyrhizobium sp. NAS80.1]|uniref:ABC transporter permease n=1 Tax=Bradyrhizobium sp. NAS80.1 TaxID=1680159 RepID=UPI000A033705|nr:ABC transporter permease [Bradyrhizobium sp. NAS80.1]
MTHPDTSVASRPLPAASPAPIALPDIDLAQTRSLVLWRRFRRNRAALLGLILFVAVVLMAALADVVTPGDPLRIAGSPLTDPLTVASNPWGTDQLGRDIMSGIFHGARISLAIGVVATVISIAIGVVIGAVAGYFGGRIDGALMRVTEAFQTIPSFVLLLTLVAIFGSSIEIIVIAIGIVSWTAPARMVRAEFMSLRRREFVDAARNLGVSDMSIIFREILPNALPPVVVFASVVMANSILMESALAFLGLGDPNYASWGNMIGQGRAVLRTAWFCSVIPGVAILLTVLSFSLMGEGLNDALNPRQKR